jgi:gluconokinase
LRAEPALTAKRFTERRGQFMSASLIASQFERLETPEPEENALTLDVSQPLSMLVEFVERTLDGRQGKTFLSE